MIPWFSKSCFNFGTTPKIPLRLHVHLRVHKIIDSYLNSWLRSNSQHLIPIPLRLSSFRYFNDSMGFIVIFWLWRDSQNLAYTLHWPPSQQKQLTRPQLWLLNCGEIFLHWLLESAKKLIQLLILEFEVFYDSTVSTIILWHRNSSQNMTQTPYWLGINKKVG